jgi:hypothetical protein
VDKIYYTAEMIETDLGAYEDRYGLSSAEFYREYSEGSDLSQVMAFDRVVWADLYRALLVQGRSVGVPE